MAKIKKNDKLPLREKYKKEKIAPNPTEIDCCKFIITGYGQSSSESISVGNRIDLDQRVNSFSSVDASAIASSPPGSSSDSDSASDIATSEKKGVDLVAKTDKYTINWRPLNAQGNVVASIHVTGEISDSFPCVFGEGSLTLSNFKIINSLDNITKNSVTITINAVDNCGSRSSCTFNIREP